VEGWAVGPAVPATDLSEADRIESEAAIFRAAAEEAGTPSEAVRGDTTGQELALPAAAALPAWVPGAAVEVLVVAAEVGGVGRPARTNGCIAKSAQRNEKNPFFLAYPGMLLIIKGRK